MVPMGESIMVRKVWQQEVERSYLSYTKKAKRE